MVVGGAPLTWAEVPIPGGVAFCFPMGIKPREPRAVNFVANTRLRNQFLSRFMVAHTKNHNVAAGKKRRRPTLRARASKPQEPSKPPTAKAQESPRDEREPTPDELVREETPKPEVIEEPL